MKHLLATVVAIPLLSGVAFAGEPMKLDNSQMDQITAGSASGAFINLLALAQGASSANGSVAAASTQFQAAITQSPVNFVTPFGTTKLQLGAVAVIASSASAD